MGTKNIVVRTPPDLRELAEARAEAERRSLSDVVKSALRAYLTGADGDEALNHAVRRAQDLEAKLDRARAELAGLRASAAADTTTTLTRQADRFIEALQAATFASPVTTARLIAVSGWGRDWVADLLTVLVREGYVARPRTGFNTHVPGTDLREGVRIAELAAERGLARIAPSKRKPPDSQSPAPVPHATPAAATGTAEGKNAAATGREPPNARTERPPARKRASSATRPTVAAKGRQAVVTELLERGDLVPASELPAAPVFKAGPDVDCGHENMRIRKGVCPDCKQWVTK